MPATCSPKVSGFKYLYLGMGRATKSDEFSEKFQRGRGVIFNPKIYIADFGNFKQGFLSMKLITRRVISGFRVCFFKDLVAGSLPNDHRI